MTSVLTEQEFLQLDLFRGFGPEEVRHIASESQLRRLAPGEILIEPRRPNDTLFLLVDGLLKIVLEKDGTELSFPIKAGECLGEMSILMDRPTSGLAVALKESLVLCIPEPVFWECIMTTRPGARNIMSQMAARLQRSNHALIKEVEEQLRYKHLQKELETAGKIQANIVPDGALLFPQRPEVDAFALISQAREVGGDFYDALVLDDEHIYLAIGDVSGKGMPAALFMVRAFTFLRLLISNNPGFEDVIPALNRWLSQNNEDMMFVSLFAGVLNLHTGVLRYVNAGHNPPFASLNGEAYQLFGSASGPLVGVLDQARFDLDELALAPGDSLLLYTDGVPEATNTEHGMFATEQVQAVLNQVPYPTMKDLVLTLQQAVESFVGNSPQYDDFTAFALRYHGPRR